MDKLYLVVVDTSKAHRKIRVVEFAIKKSSPKTYFAESMRMERRFHKDDEDVLKSELYQPERFSFYTTDADKIDELIDNGFTASKERIEGKAEHYHAMMRRMIELENKWNDLGEKTLEWETVE